MLAIRKALASVGKHSQCIWNIFVRRGRGMTEVTIFAIYSQFLGKCPMFTGNFKDSYSLVYSPMCESSIMWLILLYVAFCTIMAISRQKEARSRDYSLLLFRMISRVLYSAQYHRQHCTLHAFKQFGAMYMHIHDDKYPSRPGFEHGTPRLQTPVDTIVMSHRCRPRLMWDWSESIAVRRWQFMRRLYCKCGWTSSVIANYHLKLIAKSSVPME